MACHKGVNTIERKPFDLEAYIERIQTKPCFICEMIAGQGDSHHIIYRDDTALVFLNKYPTLYGYVLVSPVEHREQVTGDFSLEEYLKLQTLLYQVAEAVRRAVPTERLYLLSLGSQQGNRHVHWHVAPLPPGVPFEHQQLAALSVKEGILQFSEEEMTELARRIRQELQLLIGGN